MHVPFHKPSIGDEELEAIKKVLASGWLTTGPTVHEFERQFAAFIGCEHALAVNSATAALQLAVDAIGLQPGDEVLVPTYTFTATAAVVVHAGARPILCDSCRDGFNICVEDAERRITPKTRAIIPVHIAGQPCNLDAVHALAAKHGLHVIEDAAHALPSSYNGARIGAISELTAFSFYATKTLSTGEGGMLTTNNDTYFQRATKMRLHGISGDAWRRYSDKGNWYYDVQYAGYKLNMCDVLAAIGCVQLKKSKVMWERRRAIATIYTDIFSRVEELQVPPEEEVRAEHAWHLYILRIRPEALTIGRDEYIQALKQRGIGTSVHFIPLHLHSFYAEKFGYRRGDFPNAENAYSRCLSLPIFPDMTDAEVEHVIDSVKALLDENRIPLAAAS
jgi:dTDP-4-amino-4,6-dideoxygalactose transaminase